jgi:ferredoxin-NADP reductase
VKSIRLTLEGEADFKAGQFLSVTLKNNPELKRYLSISNSPTEGGYLEFTKKLSASAFSQALNSLKPDDAAEIQYPFGKFTLEENPAEKIAFLSGGIGITPIRSMVKFALDKKLAININLLYANRTVKDIAFREDFEAMCRGKPDLKVVYVLGEAEAGFRCLIGRIDSVMIKQEIPDYSERKFFLCGPPAMVEAMKKILSGELSLPATSIVTENFQGY